MKTNIDRSRSYAYTSRRRSIVALIALTAAAGCTPYEDDGENGDENAPIGTAPSALSGAPPSALPAPADYDGNGSTDFAVKGDNTWYIDYGVNDPKQAEIKIECSGHADDDNDGVINDGCPAVDTPETTAAKQCDDMVDSDGDGVVNDGCPCVRGRDVYGGAWDAANSGWGSDIAIPVPADYDGDGRADLAIKVNDDSGMWAIDYAENGFNGFNEVRYGYGGDWATPVPADYDGDGRADMAVKSTSGDWLIDYADNGFNGWDIMSLPAIYGDATSVPVPGDYDGDGSADLAIKNDLGQWKIDYANTGFGAWDVELSAYGFANARPVPFNYDPWRDNKADLAIKDDNTGDWYIDYAYNGFGLWDTPIAGPSTPASPFPTPGYGGSWTKAIPGDYDGDKIVDLAVLDTSGIWFLDRGFNGWLGWDIIPGTSGVSIDNPNRELVDLTRPHIESTKIFGEPTQAPWDKGAEVTQLVVGTRYTIEVTIDPGTGMDRRGGVEINQALDVPAALDIVGRTGTHYVEDFRNDSQGDPVQDGKARRRFPITCRQPGNFPLGFQLRSSPPYTFFQSSPGVFEPPEVYNPDHGIRVECVAPQQTGLSGQLRARKRDPVLGVFVTAGPNAGPPISGATITDVETGAQATSLADGTFALPVSGGPRKIQIHAPGYSDTVVINLTIPPEGLQMDVQLEQAFTNLAIAGVTYATYIDYSRGRTLFHTVKLNRQASAVSLGRAAFAETNTDCLDPDDDDNDNVINDGCPAQGAPETNCGNALDDDLDGFPNDGCPIKGHVPLDQIGDALGSDVMINGTWWNIETDNPLGYMYPATDGIRPEVNCSSGLPPTCTNSNTFIAENGVEMYDDAAGPMFTIAGGTGANQEFDIVQATYDFTNSSTSRSNPWTQLSRTLSIFDNAPKDGISDVSYALEISNPPLVRTVDGTVRVIRGGDFRLDELGNYDHSFARTSIGIAADGNIYLVIADGEGVHGTQGATANQLARFYKDVLGATHAMGIDSGLSTQMLLRTDAGQLYRLSTVTGEDATIDNDPYGPGPDPNLWSTVAYYVEAHL